jgi:site-specific recombinase XerD
MKRNLERQLDTIEEYLYKKGYSVNSARSYRSGIRIFLQSNPDAEKYAYIEVLQCLEQKPHHIITLNTRKGYLTHIKKYYDYLLDTGKRDDHPCRSLFIRGNVKKGIIHSDLFSITELENLMNREEHYPKMHLKNQVVISLLIYQGLMPQEIVNLKLSDIDLDSGTIRIRGGRVLLPRTLNLQIRQAHIMDNYINRARKELTFIKTDKLIINYRGLPDHTDNIQYLVETYRGVFPSKRLTTKTIRDSVISYWLNERKIPLEQVQLMAGHRWISSTERYVQASIDEQREILRKVHPLG